MLVQQSAWPSVELRRCRSEVELKMLFYYGKVGTIKLSFLPLYWCLLAIQWTEFAIRLPRFGASTANGFPIYKWFTNLGTFDFREYGIWFFRTTSQGYLAQPKQFHHFFFLKPSFGVKAFHTFIANMMAGPRKKRCPNGNKSPECGNKYDYFTA